VTEAPISIDNDVILDGEGNLMLDGESAVNNLFTVPEVVTAELHGFTVTGGGNSPCDDFFGGCAGVWNEGTLLLTNGTLTDNGSGVLNTGTLTMTDTAASENEGYGILNRGEPATLTVTNSTLSGNVEAGIFSELGQVNVTASTISGNGAGESDGNGITLVMARLTITNSTVSDNLGIGIDSGQDIVTVTHSTISGNGIGGLLNGGNDLIGYGAMTVTNSIVDDNECEGPITSNGYNIESPGNSCGFDQGTDQVDLTEGELNLAPLADNGGPTMTHALLTEPVVSVAVDVIPADDCVDAEGELLPTDQRGEPRFVGPPFGPSEPVGDGCDVGAFEVQPEP
jgi:hypothetical protein